jgi:hypothetical protein
MGAPATGVDTQSTSRVELREDEMNYEQSGGESRGMESQYGYGHGERQHEQQARQGMETAKHTLERVEGIPTNVYYGGVIGSIVASALLMMMGKRNLSLFVGLWPPTLLNMALFTKQLRPSREVGSA